MIKQAARLLKEIISHLKSTTMTEVVSPMIPEQKTAEINSSSDNITQEKTPNTEKRQHEEELSCSAKKQKTEGVTERDRTNRKKVIMLLAYCGKNYLGMQRNPGARTIESDLMEALLKAGLATKEQIDNPNKKMYFQRAARTDKGVSAAGQICSLMMDINVENPVEKINEHLVEQIHVIAIQRVTKRFDSKNAASARTYQYLLPTYAFTPFNEFVLEKYRITDDVFENVNKTLALFKGTKNFHNFTSGKKSTEPSAKRYVMEFSMGTPFVRKELEFAVISVKGQSFMLHQIRKMIGLTIAIVRGLTATDAIEKAYGPDKCDVPKAPGLGLMLEKVHYDYYNKRFGNDGVHEPILWDKYESEINSFKETYIYPSIIETEIEEKSMMKWLATLHLHHFDVCKDQDDYGTPLKGAYLRVKQLRKEKEEESDCIVQDVDIPSDHQPSAENERDAHKLNDTSGDENLAKECEPSAALNSSVSRQESFTCEPVACSPPSADLHSVTESEQSSNKELETDRKLNSNNSSSQTEQPTS